MTNNAKKLKAIETIRLATEADKAKNYAKALEFYQSGIEDFLAVIKGEPNVEQRKSMRARVVEYLDRAEKIKTYVENGNDSKPQVKNNHRNTKETKLPNVTRTGFNSKPKTLPSSSKAYGVPSTSISSDNSSKQEISHKLLKKVNSTMGREILNTIVDLTEIRLDDIEGHVIAKRALEEAVILPNINPELFTGLRQPSKGILLFGPPGNGKTMLAKAAGTEAKCTFFNVSAATIMSKWVGEAEKMVQTLFQMARNGQPSIIFVDELDSMLAERSDNENGCARRVKTEFLLQFDGFMSRQEDRILILGATNRPQELDEGILRRFTRRIFIDLPDETTRRNLVSKTFRKSKTKTSFSPTELSKLAEFTEGYSNSDIVSLCREAAMVPLRNMTREELAKVSPSQLRSITFEDVQMALNVIKPSTNPENLQKLREFASKHAQVS
uniref:microtubule-severing ATPase n=1 Tax=Acrobeloides nanus TaxID=290746 RepID=A0A914CB85_9BILA